MLTIMLILIGSLSGMDPFTGFLIGMVTLVLDICMLCGNMAKDARAYVHWRNHWAGKK